MIALNLIKSLARCTESPQILNLLGCWLQYKCYAHHLKKISKALDGFKESDNLYLKEVHLLLKTAMILKQIKDEIPEEQYHVAIQNLGSNAARLLRNTRDGPVKESIAKQV